MSLCAVKRGIISLRDCGQEATDTCASCSRPICREHTKVSAGTILCVECYARREEEAIRSAGKKAAAGRGAGPARGAGVKTSSTNARDDWEDPTWPYFYRHSYYTHSSYHPFYSGTYYDSYYDDYDLRSFHHHSADTTFDDERGDAGGFYDS